ncbi:MAG: tetratricopeptide repeat protein [Leptospiraceae bacterium]|nr:tetratricopeptide repeat protein [Leptospiraceae bacterium]
MQVKFEEGNFKLREGEFENAKHIFFELLDIDPNKQEYVAGYYIASYWDNRIESILTTREGKFRGNLLVEMFNQFVQEITKRAFPKNDSYESVTFCILSEASTQFRIAYQKEGMHGLDKNVLSNLAMCLIRIGDYKNARDILEYSKKFQDVSMQNLFYEAECLYHLGDHSRSRMYYRLAMLNNPDLLNLEIVKSEPLTTAIMELGEQFESQEEIREILPVYCLEKNLIPEIRDYSREEVNQLFIEMMRLESNLNTERPELKFKLNCRILNIGLTILDTFPGQINSELTKKVKNKINIIDPEILDRRADNKREKDL